MGRIPTILLIILLVWLPCAGNASEPSLVFESDIAPTLQAKCGQCHSDAVQEGGLDLSSMASLRRGGDSEEPLVSDLIDESLLWQQVNDGHMPPPDEPQLEAHEIERLRQWIEQGAASVSMEQAEPEPIHEHDVIPITLLRCAACHGAKLKRAGLDLRNAESILAGGRNGPAVIAGDSDGSPLIQRIESEACPPQDLLLKFFVRRPSTAEVDTLREWIDSGAVIANVAPDVATTESDPYVSDEDRQHWAFVPPQRSDKHSSIDGFIEAKLKAVGLSFSERADRDALIRRVFIDLTGMPPSVEQWRRWRSHPSPQWYAKLVDDVLASPMYGQRWGRYWLDLAGYADSEGGVSSDPIREVAWKYRDYVIDAFNDDKPYDRFLIEQLAGDELIDYENAETVTDQMVDNLVATGFLRMGIDQTGSRTMNFVPERLGVVSDAISIVSSGLMGLTLECAKCHTHKYDPIPHRDYYRFKAIFQGALDEHHWLSFKTRKIDLATPQHQLQVDSVNPPLVAKVKQLERRMKKAVEQVSLTLLSHYHPELSNADHAATLAALRVADNSRTLRQRTLVEMLQRAELVPVSEQPTSVLDAREVVNDLEDEIASIRKQMVPSVAIRALWDRGEPSPTYILRRGEHDKPGRLVGPGVPSVLTDGKTPFDVKAPFPGGTAKTGRRLALARWMTQADHPLTSRVMVNRIWHHHFGVGIVKSLENFGVQGDQPSHPELLDFLATEFIDRQWSVKQMHRLIMNSRTYQQSSRVSEDRLRHDLQNRLLSRMTLKRLDAEALRDSLLSVSGRLDTRQGGPPDRVSVDRDGMVSVLPNDCGRWRRSVYAQFRRTEIPTMLDTFDYPEMGPNCLLRSESTVSPQSLMLMNNGQIRQLAGSLARRVQSQVDALTDDPTADRMLDQIDSVYAIALSREPSSRERTLGIEALKKMKSAWPDNPLGPLESYCHMILNSAAFMYVD